MSTPKPIDFDYIQGNIASFQTVQALPQSYYDIGNEYVPSSKSIKRGWSYMYWMSYWIEFTNVRWALLYISICDTQAAWSLQGRPTTNTDLSQRSKRELTMDKDLKEHLRPESKPWLGRRNVWRQVKEREVGVGMRSRGGQPCRH